jgi:Xaa-Pro dipeptidase
LSSAHNPGYRSRQQAVVSYLEKQSLDAALLVDLEGQRNRSVRYLCGNPRDALLLVTAAGRSVLVPWDVPLAERCAVSDRIVPFTDFGRSLTAAARALLEQEDCARVEVSGQLSYPQVCALKQVLEGRRVVCRQDGIDAHVLGLRQVKDPEEISSIRRACAISDSVSAELPGLLACGPLPEHELALFIEKRVRELGAEGLGFDILAAAPERSFAIHTTPNVSSALFGGPGLSILDFGVRVDGYTSDVTIPVARGKLSALQEKMVSAVEEAYALASRLLGPGTSPAEVAGEVEKLLAARGFSMPHSLGHGIGLDAHEPPLLRAVNRVPPPPFQEGMVLAVEPGLYDSRAGGVRWENDFLITSRGAERLTGTVILRMS